MGEESLKVKIAAWTYRKLALWMIRNGFGHEWMKAVIEGLRVRVEYEQRRTKTGETT